MNHRYARFTSVALLLVLFAQAIFSAGLKSPTVDEPNHLTRGYAYLKTGDLRFSRTTGHPPLFNLLCALPLALLKEIGSPRDYAGWEGGFLNAYATTFIFGNPVPLDRLFFLGRLPVMFVALCLAALVSRWAGELYGAWGRAIALLFCALDPNLIAHGRLVTTDVGAAFFYALAIYAFWRFWRRPWLPALVPVGIAMGLAQCVKFSAILLLPILGSLGLTEVLGFCRSSRSFRGPRLAADRRVIWTSAALAWGGAMAVIVLLAGLTIWAVYGFGVGQPSGWTVAVPAPAYVEGLRTILTRVSTERPTFLMGQRLSEGRWYYFGVALLVKTPLPTLIALSLAAISNRWRRFSWAEWPLLLVPLLYLGTSARSTLNLGYRHLLPILPFLWIYAGRLGFLFAIPKINAKTQRGKGARKTFPWRPGGLATCVFVSGDAPRGGRKARWAVVVVSILGIWLAAGTLGVAPDYLAYFNELAGGPDGGWRYLVDSNLDWGQDLYALKAYLAEQDGAASASGKGLAGDALYLSWFGSTYPYLYDPDLAYRPLPGHFSYPYSREAARSAYNPYHPAPGLYAISATNLQGLGLAAGDVFARFRSQEPVARIGHSIFVYEVTDPSPVSGPTCISGLEFGDLHAETAAHSLGRGQGMAKWFDHGASFILPGAEEAVYVLPSLPLGFAPNWRDVFQARAVAVHTQAKDDRLPAATVYALDRTSADALLEAISAALSSAPLNWSAATRFDPETEMHPLAVPVSFDYGLELLGYRLLSGARSSPGQALELVTAWRATDVMPPLTGNLKAFVHLLDERSQVRGGADRLDLAPLTWEPGDVLIQYHRLSLPGDAGPGVYQIELGLYIPGTMQRLAVHEGDALVADRLLLQPVQVGVP